MERHADQVTGDDDAQCRGNRTCLANRGSDHAEEITTEMVVRCALGRLGEQHRGMLYHCFYLGYTVGEAAAIIGIPVGTAKSRLFYAMKNLREILQDVCPAA